MNDLRPLAALLAFLLLPFPAHAQDVGVAAAVNQSAQGTRPNAAIRTIGLGDNVIYNERIDTNADGLVQLLLADGTTFTVGPNSSLVIDSFVYDPAAGTAQVAATLTKGVLRFIGAATSKTENGVAITTPVGVVGIRGGVTDIVMSPPSGIPPHVSMVFGNSVTLTSGGQLLGRMFEAGFSMAVGSGGGIDTMRTPAAWSNVIQQALSSSPGQTGGAQQTPTNAAVANTISSVNSGTTPPVPPIPMPPIVRVDDLGDNLVADLPNLPPDLPHLPDPPGSGTLDGYAAGMVVATDPTNLTGPSDILNLVSISTGFASEFSSIAFDGDGNPESGELTMIILDNCNGPCAVQIKFDPAGSTVTAVDENFNLLTQPVDAELKAHAEVTLPQGVNYCACDFLRWGFWSLEGTLTDPLTGDSRLLEVDHGTWVVAEDFATIGELDGLAGSLAGTTATFDGHAVGTYSDVSLGIGPTLTAGDMQMDWSFGTRSGTIDITGFGGRDLHGNLIGDASFPGFIGNLSDGVNADGLTKGSFVNDGDTIAAGVVGDFFTTDGSFTGVGVFMGER